MREKEKKRTCDSRNSLLARQIRNMHERIIETREDVSDTKDKLALGYLRSERDGVFFLGCLDFFGGLRLSLGSQSNSLSG